MYEHMTYEYLLNRMLNNVKKQNPNLDTREGSIIYNAIAPEAVELTNVYIALDNILDQTFADTASREYLIRRAKERGVIVKAATKAIRKGEFDKEIPIGTRFSLNVLNYKVIEKIESTAENVTENITIDLTQFPSGVTYQGSSGEWNGISINATNGKFGNNNGSWVQCNAGTILTFEVGNYASVTVNAYYSPFNFGIHIENNICTITCTANDYISAINITSTYVEDKKYKLECETAGNVGNVESGKLLPIDYVDGLKVAQLTDVLIHGEDEEDTEVLRERYFNSLDTKAFGGNITDYKEKTKSINGVGGVKVYPVWNGGGTVKLVIINSSYEKPSDTLIDDIQTKIDPIQNQGKGDGLAPIGHKVTVVPIGLTEVNIKTNITFRSGWTWESSQKYIDECIDDYFKELAIKWETSDNLIVRISQIESRLLDLECILDIKDTLINDVEENLIINADNIPIRGVVTSV